MQNNVYFFSAHLSLDSPEFDGTVVSKRDVNLKPMMPGEKVKTIRSVPVLSFSPLKPCLCGLMDKVLVTKLARLFSKVIQFRFP